MKNQSSATLKLYQKMEGYYKDFLTTNNLVDSKSSILDYIDKLKGKSSNTITKYVNNSGSKFIDKSVWLAFRRSIRREKLKSTNIITKDFDKLDTIKNNNVRIAIYLLFNLCITLEELKQTSFKIIDNGIEVKAPYLRGVRIIDNIDNFDNFEIPPKDTLKWNIKKLGDYTIASLQLGYFHTVRELGVLEVKKILKIDSKRYHHIKKLYTKGRF